MSQQDDVKGRRTPASGNSLTNTLDLFIESRLARVSTAIPVRVDSVEKAEGPDGPAGYVSVTPLICRIDGWNNTLSPASVPRLPYFRLQAGTAAVIMDPNPGDLGLAVFAEADCSGLPQGEEHPEPVRPASFRSYSKADGFYVGGFLGRTPETWIELDPEGKNITIHGPETVKVECKNAVVNAEESAKVITRLVDVLAPDGSTFHGDVHIRGSIAWTGEATGEGGGPARFGRGIVNESGGISNAGGLTNSGGISNTGGMDNSGGQVVSNGITLETHTHTGVQPGGGNTGEPDHG